MRLFCLCVQWFWWPILGLLIPYIILAIIGVALIQYVFPWCTTDPASGHQAVSPNSYK